MAFTVKKREERRDQTYRAALKAWTERYKRFELEDRRWGNRGSLIKRYDKWLDSPMRFASKGSFSCNCRRRKFGNPRIGVGSCKDNGCQYRQAVRTRIDNRRMCGELMSWLPFYDAIDYQG